MSDLVSIIIPCYNAEAYVGDAIESALHQSYEPIEVILIDDGSTDDSLDVIKSYGDQAIWESGKNQGVSAARNLGIEQACGTFVKFLDADDVLPEDAIQTQVEQLKSLDCERASVFGDAQLIDASGEVLRHASFRRKRDGEDPILYALTVNPGTQYPLHRREHLIEIGGFDESLPWAEDYDLHLRLQLAGIHLEYHPTDVVHVRLHGGDDRLTNRKESEFHRNPEAAFARGLDRERKIREVYPNGLTEPVREHLSRGMWSSGRKALKAGHPDVAQKYFEHAKDLHPHAIGSDSWAYRLSVRLFGPEVAESLVMKVRNVIAKQPTAS